LSHQNILKLTEYIFRAVWVNDAKLTIAIEEGRASNYCHKNNIRSNILSFKAIARFAPAVTLSRMHFGFIFAGWCLERIICTVASLIDAKHACCQGHHGHYHFPWVWCAKCSVRSKILPKTQHLVVAFILYFLQQKKEREKNLMHLQN
jgi:hypothetical protein